MKRKVSSIVGSNAGSDSSQKRSRPLSAAAQAKLDANVAVQKISNFIDNIPPSVYQPITISSLGLSQLQAAGAQAQAGPSLSDGHDAFIDAVADALVEFNLEPRDNNMLASYMSEAANRQSVRFFLKFNRASREEWIKNALDMIKSRNNDKAQKGTD